MAVIGDVESLVKKSMSIAVALVRGEAENCSATEYIAVSQAGLNGAVRDRQ